MHKFNKLRMLFALLYLLLAVAAVCIGILVLKTNTRAEPILWSQELVAESSEFRAFADHSVVPLFDYSDDGSLIAFVCPTDKGRNSIWLNGKRKTVFDDVLAIKAANGEKPSYAAIVSSEDAMAVVLDGEVIEKGASYSDLRLSRTGTIAYVREQKSSCSVIVGSQTFGPFSSYEDSSLCFSEKGSRYVFVAEKDGKALAVVDGEADGPYDLISCSKQEYAPGKTRIAKHMLPFFSRGQHVVYSYLKDGKYYLRFGENRFGPYSAVPFYSGAFHRSRNLSADGKMILFRCRDKDAEYLYLNSELIHKADKIDFPVLSSDGRSYAFWSYSIPEGSYKLYLNDEVVCTKSLKPSPVEFLKEDTALAYARYLESYFLAVQDGDEEHVLRKWLSAIEVSSNREYTAFQLLNRDKQGNINASMRCMLKDGKCSDDFMAILNPLFCGDAGKLFFVGVGLAKGDGQYDSSCYFVVEGKRRAMWDSVMIRNATASAYRKPERSMQEQSNFFGVLGDELYHFSVTDVVNVNAR